MTRREKQLTTLERIRSLGEEDARRQLDAARQDHDYHQTRLGELEGYLVDYRKLAVAGCSPAVHLNREDFICRLQQAVDLQTGMVRNAEKRLEHAERYWISRRQDVMGISQLLQREKSDQRRELAQREQRNLDEQASMRALPAEAIGGMR